MTLGPYTTISPSCAPGLARATVAGDAAGAPGNTAAAAASAPAAPAPAKTVRRFRILVLDLLIDEISMDATFAPADISGHDFAPSAIPVQQGRP